MPTSESEGRRDKLFGFFGRMMKVTAGKSDNPGLVNEALRRLLS
jgi:Asp-tRNA(Asn)/Glu-tRNA(Gln) amidotransferase B subunit